MPEDALSALWRKIGIFSSMIGAAGIVGAASLLAGSMSMNVCVRRSGPRKIVCAYHLPYALTDLQQQVVTEVCGYLEEGGRAHLCGDRRRQDRADDGSDLPLSQPETGRLCDRTPTGRIVRDRRKRSQEAFAQRLEGLCGL